jgi:uncharacterized membrane protein
MNFLKTTVIGGLLFLVPLVVLGLVVAKAISVLLVVAEPMAAIIPLESIGGIALANVIAAGIILLVCFLAGLLARTESAKKVVDSIESTVMHKIPGYTFLQGLTSTLNPEETSDLKPVLVSLGSSARIGLEVEHVGEDRIAVYFPGSPNAWSGIVQIVSADQIKPIDVSMMSVIEHAEQLGRGTHDLLQNDSESQKAPD